MPLIPRPNYNQIFASQAPDIDKPAVFNNYPEGWGPESRPNNGKPTIKGFNYLQQTSDLKDLWILQNGACLPYDESIEYADGAPVLKDGVIQYKTASGFKSRDAVTIPTYNSASDGVDPVTGIADGAYFNVRSSSNESYADEYQNVGGVPTPTGKSYPSSNSLIRTYNSVLDLLAIPSPQHGQVAFVRHYDLSQGLLEGGGIFVYQNTNQPISDGGYIFNGWTRQLDRPIFTPEMFGAKGDLTRDDAPSIRAATTSAYANNIKSILFSKKYLIDTPEIVGQESLLRIYPRCSYIGIGGAELVVGDNIPDKFHILAAAFFESLQPDAKSVLIDGIKFRALSAATNMDSYVTNMAIHTFGLSDVCIQNCIFDDLDTANVIVTGVKWQGVDYGARVLIQNNRFLSVVAENLNNTDHSTVYLNTPDSFALNNLFKAKTMQTAKNCCAIEVHAPNILVSNNQIFGYGRGVWLAAFEQNVTNANILNNVAHVSNHLVIVSNSATQGVFDCRISGNRVRCSHAQVLPVAGEVAFNGWQGILVADGQLDPNGWMLSGLIEVEKNTVHIDHSIDPKYATMVYVDQQLSVSCLDNVAYNAVGGAVFYYGSDTAFSGNEFHNRGNTSSHKKDLFIEYITSYLSNLTIENNTFHFTSDNAPLYLIGLPYVTDYDSSSIYENKVFAPEKIFGDLLYPNTLNINKFGNTVDFKFYNISVNFPAMTADQEYMITVQLPNDANFCVAEATMLPDSRFYLLTTKGIVSEETLTLRVKATATTESFSVEGVTMRVRTT